MRPTALLNLFEEMRSATDIIAITADPLEDISALRKIGFVMKGGDVVRNDWNSPAASR